MRSQRHTPGIVLGLATAAVIAWLSLWPILDRGLGYGVILVALLALFVALPMLLVLAVMTVTYARRPPVASAQVYAWMWLPVLAALLILPVAMTIDESRQEAYRQRHPAVFEQHVNLSGQPLWIDTRGISASSGMRTPMPADTPWTLSEFNRYPPAPDAGNGGFPYDGDRLRDDVATFPRRLGALDEGENHYAPRLEDAPLRRQGAAPDLASLQAHAPYLTRGYVYFHYPDRVEVSPVVEPLSVMTQDDLSGAETPFLMFHASNLGQAHVVRIEIAGQGVPLPRDAVPPAHLGCRRAYDPLGLAAIDDAAQVAVRWQTADRPDHWQTAQLALPALREIAPARARPRLPSVLLYFTADGGVRAERFMLWDLQDGRLGIHTSGVPSDMPRPRCGGVTAEYDMSRVQRLD